MPNNDFLVLLLPPSPTPETEAIAAAWRIESGITLNVTSSDSRIDFERHWLRPYGDDAFCRELAAEFDIVLETPPDDLLENLEPHWIAAEGSESTARAFIANGSVAACSIHTGHGSIASAMAFADMFAGQVVAAPAFIIDLAQTEASWKVTACLPAWNAALLGCDPAGVAHALRYASRGATRHEIRAGRSRRGK